jgi:hypothetical protein
VTLERTKVMAEEEIELTDSDDISLDSEESDVDTQDSDSDTDSEDSSKETQAEESKTEKRINDTQTALKEAQSDLTKVNQQLAEMRGEQKAIIALREQGEKVEESDWLDDPEWEEKLERNPVKAYREMVRLQRAEYANLLKLHDDHVQVKVKGYLSDQIGVQSQKEKLQPVYDALGEKAWFKGLSARDKLEAATEYNEARPQKTRIELKPPSSPAGTGKRSPKAKAKDESAAKAEAMAVAVFGDDTEQDDTILEVL